MMDRLRFEGPDLRGPWRPSGGHSGDEYGNCTLYFRCPLFGIIWWYPTGHYQTEIEIPWSSDAPLEQYKAWIDKFEGITE